MKNSITMEQKSWVYLIFFIMGILSYPLGQFFGALLSDNITDLQNILCNLGQCALDLHFILGGYIFPMLFCSLLSAMGVYAFKERSFLFALKIFAISSAASSLFFSAGIFLLDLNFFSGYFLSLIFLIILPIICSIIFKEQTNINFILRSFAVSFLGLTFAFSAFLVIFFMVGFQGAGCGMNVEEIKTQLNKFEYVEITGEELNEYPALKKATAIEGHSLDMNSTEWERTREFLDEKWSKRIDQFVINKSDLEEELNQSIVTVKMRNIFASEGYPVSENSYIKMEGDIWYVMKRYYLFSITDPEAEEELNRINMTVKNTGDVVPVELKNVFSFNGFSLPEEAKISRDDKGWIIPVGIGYAILKEEGKLNVYTGDEKTHEIMRENGKLKVVYAGPQGSPIFKIREKYYRFEFWVS
jgi:hypothetical protein